jgi:hypothetical protein
MDMPVLLGGGEVLFMAIFLVLHFVCGYPRSLIQNEPCQFSSNLLEPGPEFLELFGQKESKLMKYLLPGFALQGLQRRDLHLIYHSLLYSKTLGGNFLIYGLYTPQLSSLKKNPGE